MAEPTIRRLDQPGDLGWVVKANGEVYAEQFGWDTDYEAMVAGIVADFTRTPDPERTAGWIAELDGERVGCVMCVPGDAPDQAKLRVLVVDPTARGLGVGHRLVETCLEFAREVGYAEMVLFTTANLHSARRIYQAAGFRLVDEEPRTMFGHDLVTQNWRLSL